MGTQITTVTAAPPELEAIGLATVSPLPPDDIHPVDVKKRTLWERFVCIVWDSDYYDKSPAERRLVHKLDCGILTCLAFGYLLKYIDQTNLNNAYVSGMKEDLKIKGNQYTYMVTIYNATVCAMQIPSAILAVKFRPSWILAICEIGWMTFTFAQAGAQTYQQMYAFRFFVGFFEAPFGPAAIFILGSWYKPSELAKRVSIWFVSGTAGQAFSGFMQASIYKTMDGACGLAGWRWLYIICGLMTFPCGVAVLFCLPDYPAITKVWYLTEEEKQMAQARCALQGTKPATGLVNLKTLKIILKSWHFWVLTPSYVIYAWSVQSYGYFNTYLKLSGYSVHTANILPSTAFCIGIPVCIFWGYLSDRLKSRFALCLGPLLWGLIPTGILCFHPDNKNLRLFAFMVMQTYFITHIFYAWVNEICRGNAEERAFIIASTNILFYAFNAWLPNVVFKQTQGPRWRKGFPTLFGANIAACCCMVLVWILYKRENRKRRNDDIEGDVQVPQVTLHSDNYEEEKALGAK